MTGPLLSWLYVPGDRPDRFDRAATSGASVVILDLEDAVDHDRKEYARAEVRAYLESAGKPGDGPPLHVRVNSGPAGEVDVRALAGLPALAALRIPKVDSVRGIDALVACADDEVGVYALVESAAGLAALLQIAGHPRVSGIALGEQDLLAQLGFTSGAAIDQVRVQAVLAAAAAGLPAPPMSVYPRHRDDAGLLESTRHGRALGMFGRSAIHPRQVPVIHEAFVPSDDELTWARSVVQAGAGVGATATAAGDFVDAPVLRRARSLLDLHRQLSR